MVFVLVAAFAFAAGAAATATISTDVKMLSYNAQVRMSCCLLAGQTGVPGGNITELCSAAHKSLDLQQSHPAVSACCVRTVLTCILASSRARPDCI